VLEDNLLSLFNETTHPTTTLHQTKDEREESVYIYDHTYPEKERENELNKEMMICNRKDITSKKEDITSRERTRKRKRTETR
jgi:hypothetical protein